MAKKKTSTKPHKKLPDNYIKITRFPDLIRIRAIKRSLRKEDIFDKDGNVSCSGEIFYQNTPEILLEYRVCCARDNVRSLINNRVLRKHRNSIYSLHVDFPIYCNQTFIETLSQPADSITLQRRLNANGHGYDLDVKLVATAQFFKRVLTSYTLKSVNACHKPIPGSPRGLDRVEPWMSVSKLDTKPFEGGKCSPK